MRIVLLITAVLVLYTVQAQNQETPDESLREKFGAEAARQFIEFVMQRNNDSYFKGFSKVAMYKDGNVIDTIHLKLGSYQGSGIWEFKTTGFPIIKMVVTACGTAKGECAANLSRTLKTLQEDFWIMRYADITKKGKAVLLKAGFYDETWFNYFTINPKGLIVTGRKYIREEESADTTFDGETVYTYSGTRLAKRVFSFYRKKYQGGYYVPESREKHFDTAGRLTSYITETTTIYSDTDIRKHRSELLYSYDNRGRVVMIESKSNNISQSAYYLTYTGDVVAIEAQYRSADERIPLFSYRLVK